MRKFLISLVFIFLFVSCTVEDEVECINSFDCDYGFSCIDGICVEDTGNTGDTGNSGNTGDTGNTGDSGNSGNTGDTGNTGNTGDSGDHDVVSDPDVISDPDIIPDIDVVSDPDVFPDEEILSDPDIISDPDVMSDPDIIPDEDIIEEINECTVPSHNCNANATCIDTLESFLCDCNSYFTGSGTECTLCDTNLICGPDCAVCPVETSYCKNNGDNTTKCVECVAEENCSAGADPHCLLSNNTCVKCRDNNDCNTGAGEICSAENKCAICPLPLTLGTRDTGETGWTRTGNWILETTSTGWMRFDDDSHKTNYDYSLSYASNIDIAACSSATLNFSITLSDYAYSTSDPDKSEKMYVECSGDGGLNWTTLVPNPFPSNQSSSRCSNCYCDGDNSGFGEKSFGWTTQTMSLPSNCKTDKVRLRFRAKGGDSWRLNYWGIDAVTVN